MARERRQTLSTVVAGLLRDGLRNGDQAARRAAQVLNMWKKAFLPLTEEEMLIVDGILPEGPEPASK